MVVKGEPKRLFDMIRDFFEVELEDRKGAGTLAHYRYTMKRFLLFLSQTRGIPADELTFRDFCRKSVAAWQKSLLAAEVKPVTINNYAVVVREFLHYAALRDPSLQARYNEVVELGRMKEVEDQSVRHFPRPVLKAILAECNRRTFMGDRDYMMMVMMFDTACRLQEVIGMRLCDLVFYDNTNSVYVTGKGGKKRIVGFTKGTAQLLKRYIAKWHGHEMDATPLFYISDSEGVKREMSPDNVQRFISAYAAKARVKDNCVPETVTPHMFRHSRAMDLLAHGVDLPVIAQVLGHTNLTTTLIYAQASLGMKREALEKAEIDMFAESAPEFTLEERNQTFLANLGF